MPSYFRQVPDFEYVSRDPDQRQISDYKTVKNLFRRGKLREDIFGNLSYFTKYNIIGDERPDNVAYKIYNDETLDWVVLLSNNILNIQTEWPLPQTVFDKVMLEKYGSYDELYSGIHHYETKEIKDSVGNLIFPEGVIMKNELKSQDGFIQAKKTKGILFAGVSQSGLILIILENSIEEVSPRSKVVISNMSEPAANGEFDVFDVLQYSEIYTEDVIGFYFFPNQTPQKQTFDLGNDEVNIEFISNSSDTYSDSSNYYYQYFDSNLGIETRIPLESMLTPVTNYEYESKLEDKKRDIFLLKPQYLNVVFNDLEEIMTYKKGSSQYVNRKLKRGDNIRTYR